MVVEAMARFVSHDGGAIKAGAKGRAGSMVAAAVAAAMAAGSIVGLGGCGQQRKMSRTIEQEDRD